MFRVASPLLAAEADGATRFRLIGIGADVLVDARDGRSADPVRRELGRPRRLERAVDAIRDRLGADALRRGRGLAANRGPRRQRLRAPDGATAISVQPRSRRE